MTRSRLVLASGIAAGLVANYWALETLLADRSDPAGSWISDLGARTESTGLLFDLLEVASGLLIVLFAILILPPLGRRSRQLGWAVVALIAVGVCTVVDGAFPLSCGESLAEPCELRYDAVDLIHGGETFLSIALTIVMFGLFAAGLRAEAESGLRRLGRWAGIAGVAWIACNVMMGAQYAFDDLAEVKGLFHRGSQVILGAWLIALAIGLGRLRVPRGAKPSPGLGRIDGDGEATEPVRLS